MELCYRLLNSENEQQRFLLLIEKCFDNSTYFTLARRPHLAYSDEEYCYGVFAEHMTKQNTAREFIRNPKAKLDSYCRADNTDPAIKRLLPYCVGNIFASYWFLYGPSTRYGHDIYVFPANDITKKILIEEYDSIYLNIESRQSKYSSFFEDLCFFKGDTMLLATISHERECGAYPLNEGFHEYLEASEIWSPDKRFGAEQVNLNQFYSWQMKDNYQQSGGLSNLSMLKFRQDVELTLNLFLDFTKMCFEHSSHFAVTVKDSTAVSCAEETHCIMKALAPFRVNTLEKDRWFSTRNYKDEKCMVFLYEANKKTEEILISHVDALVEFEIIEGRNYDELILFNSICFFRNQHLLAGMKGDMESCCVYSRSKEQNDDLLGTGYLRQAEPYYDEFIELSLTDVCSSV